MYCMMSLLLAMTRSNIAAALLALLLLLAGGYGFWLRGEVSSLEHMLAEARAKALSLERSNLSLVAALKQQNAAVAELAKYSQTKKRYAEASRGLARQRSLQLQKVADDIMLYQPAGYTQCEQMQGLLDEFLRKLRETDR